MCASLDATLKEMKKIQSRLDGRVSVGWPCYCVRENQLVDSEHTTDEREERNEKTFSSSRTSDAILESALREDGSGSSSLSFRPDTVLRQIGAIFSHLSAYPTTASQGT
jgi:hypothetical protein